MIRLQHEPLAAQRKPIGRSPWWSAPLAVGVLLGVSCTIDRPISARDQLRSDYMKNHTKWVNAGVRNYSYALAMGCDSCSSAWGTFGVHVTAEAVDSVVVDSTLPFNYNISMFSDVPTVLQLFTYVDNALAMNVSGITVEFNSALGYPESIWIDYDGSRVGDEYTYRVDSLVSQ